MRALGVLLLVTLLLAGCGSLNLETPSTPASSPLPAVVGEPPVDKTWISPAKVNIGNFHLGATAEWNLRLHNGGGAKSSFQVNYMVPNVAEEGYYIAPKDIVQDWVLVADTTPVLQGQETRNVLVTVGMPSRLSEDEASFWVINSKGIKYLSEVRVAYFKEAYPASLDKFVKKYVDKVNWKFAPSEPIVDRTSLVNWLVLRGAPLTNTPELVDQLVYAIACAVSEASGAAEERLGVDPVNGLLAFLEKERSVSVKSIKASRNYSSDLVVFNEFLTKKFVSAGNLIKDRWEFWIVVYDNSQRGTVTVEMASRWLVSMRF